MRARVVTFGDFDAALGNDELQQLQRLFQGSARILERCAVFDQLKDPKADYFQRPGPTVDVARFRSGNELALAEHILDIIELDAGLQRFGEQIDHRCRFETGKANEVLHSADGPRSSEKGMAAAMLALFQCALGIHQPGQKSAEVITSAHREAASFGGMANRFAAARQSDVDLRQQDFVVNNGWFEAGLFQSLNRCLNLLLGLVQTARKPGMPGEEKMIVSVVDSTGRIDRSRQPADPFQRLVGASGA
jgi:hypothetical protein